MISSDPSTSPATFSLQRLLRLLLLLLLLPLCVAKVAAQDQDLLAMTLRDKVQFNVLKTEGEDCELSFTLHLDDYKSIPSRFMGPFWVAAPPGGSASVSVDSVEWVVVGSDGKVDGPYLLGQTTPWGVIPTVMTNVRIAPQDQLRTVNLVRGEFNAIGSVSRVVGQKTESGTAIIRKAGLKVKLTGLPDEADRFDLKKDDPYLDRLLDLLVVNKPQATLCARKPAPMDGEEGTRKWNEMLAEAGERGPILFTRLARGGIYSIRSENLRTAGVAPETLPVDRLRCFVGAEEIPLLAYGLERNRLIGKGSLILYVPIDTTDKKPYIPLWLVVGAEDDEPKRINLDSGSRGIQGTPVVVRGTVTDRIFEPNLFTHDQPMTSPVLKWSTADLVNGSFIDYEFEAVHPLPDAEGVLTSWMAGADPTKLRESAYQLLVNGEKVSDGQVRVGRVDTKDVKFPTSLLRDGVNRFTVLNPAADDPEGATPLKFVMAELKVPTPSNGLAPQKLFSADLDEPTSATVLFHRYPGFGRTGFAADVTDPLAPVFRELRPSAGPDDLSAALDFPSVHAELVYTPTEALLPVAELEAVKVPSSFLDESQVDYLVIYHPQLEEELKRLLEFRARDRSVRALSIDDVYRAYSHGEVRYQAIHDCIRHTFAASKSPRLQEVLLVGEGSEYWWERRRNSKNVSENMVPVFGWQDPNVRIRGDESYALISGSGPIADVEIARISVNSPEELRIVVDKILAYEQWPPTGDWQDRHLFVTDDEPEFIRVADAIIAKTMSPPAIPEILALQDYPYENYFRGYWRKRSVEFTDRVIHEMERGSLTLTYLGHGGPNLWSGERILHIRDIDRLVDGGRHPFLLAGSCDTGWVDYPVEPVRTSLSEHFIRKQNGGSIGAFIPIDGTSSYEHDFLLSAFFKHLMRDGVRDFGELALLAKVDYFLDRNNPSVTNQYLLMGDPASHLPNPAAKLEATATPVEVPTVTGGVLTVRGRTKDFEFGAGSATLLSPSYKVVSNDRFAIRSGDFDTTMAMPGYLDPGVYTVVVEAHNDEAGKSQVASIPVTVKETRMGLEWVTNPGNDKIQVAGKPLRVSLLISNESDLDLKGADLVIMNPDTRREVMRRKVDVKAGETVTAAFEKSLPAGVTAFQGRLYTSKPDEDRTAVILAESDLVLRAQSDLVRYLDFPLDAVEVTHPQGKKTLLIKIPVYNMTEYRLPKLAATLKRTTGTESIPLGEEMVVEPLEPAARSELQFDIPANLANQTGNYLLEIYDLSKETRRLLQLTPFTYTIKSGPDVRIVPGELYVENEKVFVGKTAYVRFKVINDGDEVARDVKPQVYIGEPWVEQNAAPNSLSWYPLPTVSELHPGESHIFRLRWDPKDVRADDVKLFATASCTAGTPDRDLANNVLMLTVPFLSPPNLRLVADEIDFSTRFLKPYETVTLQVPFENNSKEDFLRDFRLSVYAIRNDGARSRIFSRRFEGLRSGERTSLQFDWVVQPGEYLVSMNLNEDREYLEETHDDNVASFTFPYLGDARALGASSGVLDFSLFPDFGTMKGIVRQPSGALTVASRPVAIDLRLPFDPQYLIKGELGPVFKADNLWGGGGDELRLTYGEVPPPVKFRFPTAAIAGARLYDLYINTVGDYLMGEYPVSGDFKYRIEDQQDWKLETRATVGEIYMGRFQIQDDALDIEIAAPDYPTANQLYNARVVAVAGIYDSMIVEDTRPVAGRLDAAITQGGSSRVAFSVRHGRRSNGDIAWEEWQQVADGGAIPPPRNAEARLFQWRATLYVASDGSPALQSVRIELPSAGMNSKPDALAASSEVAGSVRRGNLP